MKRFAFVNNENIVTGVVVADSKEKLSEIPGGSEGIELPDDSLVWHGWSYDGTSFTPPIEEPTND